MISSVRGQRLLVGLVVAGLGGALVYSSVLATAVALLALAATVPALRQQLKASGWDCPRELRLLHFACWFPVLVYLVYWVGSGFDYDDLKALDGPARLLLFWPLVLALSWSRFGAKALFVGFGLMALGGIVHTLAGLYLAPPQPGEPLRAGLWINPIALGNLALLAAAVLLSAALCWLRLLQAQRAWLALGLAGLALCAALLTQTRSNLLALPMLFVVLSLQLSGRKRLLVLLAGALLLLVALAASQRFMDTLTGLQQGDLDVQTVARLAVWDIAWAQFVMHPWTGSGLQGYQAAVHAAVAAGGIPQPEFVLDCCAGHAHNDLLQSLATRGLLGGLSWLLLIAVPVAVFARYLRAADPQWPL